MMRAVLLLTILFARQDVGFVAYDLVLDTAGKPLAAYQLEVTGAGKVVGVEGGDRKPFAAAPYYDPAALQGGRIVLAAFTTEENAPAGKVRVARLHMQEAGATDYATKLVVAASPGGERIAAKIELVRQGEKK